MKIVISGYGKMGHCVEEVLRRRGIAPAAASEDVCALPEEVTSGAVCIDFTTPDAFRANYPFLAERFAAVVVGTTGWYDIRDEVFVEFRRRGTTLVWASNFSIGVNAFFAAVERACAVLKGRGYTPKVEETHHIHKLDAPSGTAKTVAGIISRTLGAEPEILSRRIGEVPGTHSVELNSEVDRLTLTHEAYSREGFAEGAVAAALLTPELKGIHEFKDLIL